MAFSDFLTLFHVKCSHVVRSTVQWDYVATCSLLDLATHVDGFVPSTRKSVPMLFNIGVAIVKEYINRLLSTCLLSKMPRETVCSIREFPKSQTNDASTCT